MVLWKLFHGTQAVPKIASTIPKNFKDDPVSTYVNSLLSGCTPLKKCLKLHNNITYLGAHYVKPLTLEFLVEESFDDLVKEEALILCKAVVRGQILYSMSYRKLVRWNNYTVGLNNGSIVEITNFALITL